MKKLTIEDIKPGKADDEFEFRTSRSGARIHASVSGASVFLEVRGQILCVEDLDETIEFLQWLKGKLAS